jgi:hypothetical protein
MKPDQIKKSDTPRFNRDMRGNFFNAIGIFKPKWLRDRGSGFVWTCLHRSCSLRKATERDRNKERKKKERKKVKGKTSTRERERSTTTTT